MAPPDERDRIAQITRLYLVVHGRAPDPAGLEAYVGHLRSGKTLRELAAEFVTSDEFIARIGDKDPARELCCQALGRQACGFNHDAIRAPGAAHALADLVTALILSPAVQERLAVLPALYPEGVPLHDPAAYRVWLGEMQPSAAASSEKPPGRRGPGLVLSVVMLVDDPDSQWMQGALDSVFNQSSASSEVVLVSRKPLLDGARRAAYDPHLTVVTAPLWGGTAALFNRALSCCKGEFTALIGQHDHLAPMVASELDAIGAAADLILTDDDALDQHGLRHSPRLGTAWDPDRALAADWPGLILGRTALLRRIRGMRAVKGAEEWDLLLRAAARPDTRILHVPLVMLSRRGPARHLAVDRTRQKAAQRLLRRAGHRRALIQPEQGILRVVYPLPRRPPQASIIIPTRDHAELLRTCTAGLLERTAYPDIELVIVDNGSREPDALTLLRNLASDQRVRVVVQPGPFNWSALNNVGVARMRGDVAVLLNNDIEIIEPGWLRELVSQAIRPEVGVVGAKLLYRDRTVQHAGVVLGPAGRGTHMWRHTPGAARGYLDQLICTRQVTATTGACLAVRREVYQAVGGCEENLPVTWNDVDLCLRVRALGLRVIWAPHACLFHLEQATRGTDETPEHQIRYAREQAFMRARWGSTIDADPFLNPNLRPSENPNETQPRLIIRK